MNLEFIGGAEDSLTTRGIPLDNQRRARIRAAKRLRVSESFLVYERQKKL